VPVVPAATTVTVAPETIGEYATPVHVAPETAEEQNFRPTPLTVKL
jgi:hypothetical protein